MTALSIEAGPAATCKIDKKIKNSEIGQGENRGTGPGRMACGILVEVSESAVRLDGSHHFQVVYLRT